MKKPFFYQSLPAVILLVIALVIYSAIIFSRKINVAEAAVAGGTEEATRLIVLKIILLGQVLAL